MTRVFVGGGAGTGGSLAESHARKICKVMDKATSAGAPVIGAPRACATGSEAIACVCGAYLRFVSVVSSCEVMLCCAISATRYACVLLREFVV